MKKIITVDGNEACSNVAYLFTEVAGIYPITPSSPMAELVDEWSNKGKKNLFDDTVKVVEMQSEAGAAGLVHGSLQTGCLTTTFTASQGLLLMIPNMYKMAGEMLPCVMHVAARSLSTHALSIFGDHQDIYAARQTGFCMLASSSVQDASLLSGVAHLAAIKSSLPFVHFFDGFRTSHELNKVIALSDEDYLNLLDRDALNKFRSKALNPMNPSTKGTAQNDDVYFQATEVRNKFYTEVPNIVDEYMQKINALAGTDYKPFNYYGAQNPIEIIIAMGSVCETIKETIDYLNSENYNIGLIEVHLYRPFSIDYLNNVLPQSVKRVAVLDRTKEPGSIGEPLYLDVTAALSNKDLTIVGGRYGLSSKDTNPSQIKAVFDMLKDSPVNNFTIGINDDVTNLSLKLDNNFKIKNADEFLIFGYGSDGMVSASKSIIKLAGSDSNKYVQGYFQYDSKKSGGVTVSHLRFSDKPIRSTYYVQNPKLVVCTKDTYLDDFDMLSGIEKNGIFLLNTDKNEVDVEKELTNEMKQILLERNIKFYIIDAYDFADKLGLTGKISTIIESIILYLTNIVEYDKAKEDMKNYAKKRFFKKGEEVISANYKAIDDSINYLKEVKLSGEFDNIKIVNQGDLYTEINSRRGNALSTSMFLDNPDGTFQAGTSSRDKRGIAEEVPKWLNENCIMCNQCSFNCPHGVIRPFLLDENEFNNAPDYIKEKCLVPITPDMKDYKYILSFSVKDCTGCGICVNSCPGKKGVKALEMYPFDNMLLEQEVYNYLSENVSVKKEISANTIKGSQFKKPRFAFSGACAGCGETPYIKLLTQLFGDELVVANATGCSSIFSGSVPSTAFETPWASSLFEDNAEYGFGMLIATNTIRNRIRGIMKNNMDNPNSELFTKWIENMNDFETTKDIYNQLNYSVLPQELVDFKDYIPKRSIWTIGGDGWAYDIGFGGIDHVLASNENVNILVLDTQVYSNTGGQSSKASEKGSLAAFTSNGKSMNKKDLARVALSYPHVYVAQVSLGANQTQLIKALVEAEKHQGPSIVIAYSPCISHGIKGGLVNSIEHEKMATQSGYFPIFRYDPSTEKFTLDSKNVNFDLYEEFLNSQTRFSMLKAVNEDKANSLLESNKENAIKRFEYYKNLDNN